MKNIEIMQLKDKYRLLFPYEKFPKEIDKEEVDKTLQDIKESIIEVRNKLYTIYNTNEIIDDILYYMFDGSCIDFDSGKIWKLDFLISNLEDFQKRLKTENEDIPSKEEVETIKDLGYSNFWTSTGIYELELENNDERQVVREIILEDKPIYRERTIIWELTEGGKKSKDIIYENLDIDDNMLRIINNTKRLENER